MVSLRGWRVTAALCCLCACLFAPVVHAAVSHDSNLRWQSIKSPHFIVHYHQGLESRAKEVLAIAEDVHQRLTKEFDWVPTHRAEFVLTDEYDVANGYATMFPSNRMTLLMAPPDDVTSLEDHAGWLETVITHEYVHILHLDKARGYPKAVRYVLGRFPANPVYFFLNTFPNMYQPDWLIEGIATYYETDVARGIGRGQSSFFDMMMRQEVEGGIKPLSQINQEVDTWPHGHVPYLYGVHFYNFLASKYGADKIQKYVHVFSGNVIPFRLSGSLSKATGKGLDELWAEFVRERQDKHLGQLNAIRAQGERAGARLTQDGYSASDARALPDGTVYYIAFDGRNHPELMRWRPGDKAAKRLVRVNYGTRLDVHPTAGVLLIEPDLCRNTRYYFDLYRVDLDGGGKQRLTHCARYRNAVWSTDGKRIAAVHLENGYSSLDILDDKGQPMQRLWTGSADEVPTTLDWSPDGQSIVTSMWRRDNGWDIELMTLADKRWRKLTSDSAIDSQPQFSRDGKSVLFSSDHGGVYNIRRVTLAESQVTTLSNVTGGAFYPTETATDGSLYYIGYGSAGFDLYRLDAPTATATPRVAPGTSGVLARKPEPVPASAAQDYAPWSSVRPYWWLPHINVEEGRSEWGVMTGGWDSLQRHIYYVDAAYDFVNDTPAGSVDYIYDRYFPILKLHASRDNLLERNSEDKVERVRHSDTYRAEVVLPFLSVRSRTSLHFAALHNLESDHRLQHGATSRPEYRDDLAGAALMYNSARTYPLSISRSHGRELRLVGESSDAFGKSDFTGEVYTFDWREFIPLGREHVLAFRFVEGWGTDNPRPFRLGGSSGAQSLPHPLSSALDSPFDVRNYALRGYPDGLAGLEGRRMQLASLEYRFPITRIERGFRIPAPGAVHNVSGAVFVDSGDAWNDGSHPTDRRMGAGVEAIGDLAIFFSYRFQLRIGYAHGFDTGGDDQVYMHLGAAF
jgi:hypothetical protein